MSEPKFSVGDKVTIHCPCGCTHISEELIVTERREGDALLWLALLGTLPDSLWLYKVSADAERPYQEAWLHPVEPPAVREKGLETLISNLDTCTTPTLIPEMET